MFGVNAFGWPYFGEGYAPPLGVVQHTIAPGSRTFTADVDSRGLLTRSDSRGMLVTAEPRTANGGTNGRTLTVVVEDRAV